MGDPTASPPHLESLCWTLGQEGPRHVQSQVGRPQKPMNYVVHGMHCSYQTCYLRLIGYMSGLRR